ncbi:MAG: methyl-accepting chemotaxis protein [Desulfatibacillaceae bacterium]
MGIRSGLAGTPSYAALCAAGGGVLALGLLSLVGLAGGAAGILAAQIVVVGALAGAGAWVYVHRFVAAPAREMASAVAGDREISRATVQRAGGEMRDLAREVAARITVARGALADAAVRADSLQHMVEEWDRTLPEIVTFVERVTAGDLTASLDMDVDSEGLGTLSNLLNSLCGNLKIMAAELQDAAGEVADTLPPVIDATRRRSSEIGQQSAAVAETTTTVDQVRQTAQQTAERTSKVSVMVQESTDVAARGLSAVEKNISAMAGIKEQVGTIAENILALSEQTQQIGQIISSVNDIADQSNLLALNAAVEAARAGEAGRGFAVVAGEVRNLADQSRQATAKVREILSDIQKAANTAVMVTEEGIKRVDMGVELAKSTGEAIRTISDKIGTATLAARQIAVSTNEQLVGMDQIILAMESITEVSSQAEKDAEEMEGAVGKFETVASELNSLSRRYRVR